MFIHTHKTDDLGVGRSEVTQFIRAQAGCAGCLNQLMVGHEGLIQAVVRQQVLGDLPFSEALQAGRIGLWRAILGFDPSRGLAFSTYAWPCIKHQLWRTVKTHTRLFCGERTALRGPDAPDPAMVWEAQTIQRALRALVCRLPPRLEYVVVARYGLHGYPPLFYRQIGTVLGLTGERARQLHSEALVWLRHPAHSYHLRSLVDRHTLSDYEQTDEEAQRWLHRRGGRHGQS